MFLIRQKLVARLHCSVRHVIVALVVIHAAKYQKILRLRGFPSLHVDVGLRTFVGKCPQIVLAIAGHTDVPQLYRTLVVIVVRALGSFVHVGRLHGFFGKGRDRRLPERLQLVYLVAFGNRLGRNPAQIVHDVCLHGISSTIAQLIVARI